MTQKHYAYPSIEQFRNVIYNINHKANYVGNDENGDPIYDPAKKKPVLKFIGTTKLHGTNAGVVLDIYNDEIYCQSKENVITVEKDNAGFARYIDSFVVEFYQMIYSTVVAAINKEIDGFNIITVYGEWCGGNIQKGVALNGLDKMFVIFDVKVRNSEAGSGYWLSHEVIKLMTLHQHKVYNIYEFPTWEIDIDFNFPQLSQNKLIEITEEIERKCPVGLHFGNEGTGEGVVWKPLTPGYNSSDYWMKVKGEKHSVSKVKKLASVDVERISSIKEFVDMVVTPNRCIQSVQKLKEAGKPTTRQSLADYLRWIHNDIVKEESDTLTENGFTEKEVNSHISTKAREWFFENELTFDTI